MKKRALTILLIFCFQFIYAEKYALIIAIGDYPRKTGWSTISSVNDVPLIKQTLLNQNFHQNNIQVLINDKATYLGINEALNSLLAIVNSDDVVVIHYSGHGQQIFDDENEEIDGKDEALVPYDAWVRYTHNYKGKNHFRDDELGDYITKFRNKLKSNGQFLLVLDSCHSGSATRGGKARGSQGVFAPVGWQPNSRGKETGSDMTEVSVEKLSNNPSPFVLISGASANELNYEYKGTGSLSYAFSKAMGKLGNNYSYNQLFAKIQVEMNIIAPKQNPTIEGDKHMKIFKNEYVKQQPYFEIKTISRPDVIKVQAGKLHGLFKNTTVNILPSATTKATDNNIVSKGTVIVDKFNEVIIKLDTPLADVNEKNYWVFIDKPTYGDIEVDVFFDKTTEDDPIRKGIRDFLTDHRLGSVVEDISEADIVLMKQGNRITLNTTHGLEPVDKSSSTNEENNLEELTQKIFDFAQGQYLKKIEIKNFDYEIEFKLLPIEFDDLTETIGNFLPEESFVNENGVFQVTDEVDHVVVQVTNKSKKPLYFSIIEINSKGDILTFMPNDNYSMNDDERRLNPGQTMVFKDYVYSFGPPYEKLILKAFATPYPINFQSTVNTRGENSRSYSNPLEKLLANSYSKSRGSSGHKTNSKLDGYSTEFIYEIIRKKKNK